MQQQTYSNNHNTSAPPPRGPRERLSFRLNQPQLIELEDAQFQGDEQASHSTGEIEHRYWLTEHRICWVPSNVHDAIQQHNGSGNSTQQRGRYVVTRRKDRPWDVRPVTDPTLTVPAPPQAKPAQQQPAAPQAKPLAQPSLMGAALCRALDAAIEAERYAASLGRPLSFDTQDIRAIAATLYIQAKQEAR